MEQNPYQSPPSRPGSEGTPSAKWLIWLGKINLIVAATCVAAAFVVTAVGMAVTFEKISRNSGPTGSEQIQGDVTRAIDLTCLLGEVAILFAIPGVISLIAGFILWRFEIRRSSARAASGNGGE